MSKNGEDSLQEIVEQIENGKAVEIAIEGLPAEEAEIVRLISAIRNVSFPRMDEVTVATQEAEIRAATMQLSTSPPEETAVTASIMTYIKSWFNYLQTRRELSYGLAGALLVILLFAAWLIRSGNINNEELISNQPLDKAITGETQSNAGESAVTPNSESDATLAGAPATPGTSTFLPMVSIPLSLSANTAVLENNQGVVEVQNPDGRWTVVSRMDSVSAGQHIRTGPFSSASLTFFDGSRASLGPNTEMSLDQINAQKPENGFRTIVMTQLSGSSDHDVDFRGDSGSRYEVMTPNGSGRARGTNFHVAVGADHLTQYIVNHGRVDVTNLNVTVIIVAGQTSLIPPQQPPSQPYFTVSGQGEVTAVGETWTIGGQVFTTTENTITVGNPQIGDIVSILGYILPDGTLVATHIMLLHQQPPANQFTLSGLVESIAATEWQIAGQTITVNEQTAVDQDLVVGDTARTSGTILADGTLLATSIAQIEEGQPFSFTGIVEAIAPDSWIISGVTVAIDANTEIDDDDIEVGTVVSVSGEILADGSWLAEEIEEQDEETSEFEFSGEVQSIDPWNVGGIAFTTDAFTQIDSGIAIGDQVVVSGRILADGTWLATEVRLVADETITFNVIGVVDSMEPWIVGGIAIMTDENTLIDDDISIGSEVRVQGIIQPDSTLLALLITPMDDEDADDVIVGCFTFTTVILGVNGNQVNLQGLTPVTFDDDTKIEGDLAPNSTISISICIGGSNITIINVVNIVVIQLPPPPAPPPPPPPSGGDSDDDDDDD